MQVRINTNTCEADQHEEACDLNFRGKVREMFIVAL